MADRPAKRQRRLTTLSDDDHGDNEVRREGLPLRATTRPNSKTREPPDTGPQPKTPRKRSIRPTVKDSPKSSPEKTRKIKNLKPEPPSKSLHNFFSKATDEQRWHRKSVTPEVELSDGTFGDDIVDDDSVDDSLVELVDKEDVRRSTSVIQSDQNDRIQPPPTSSQRRFVKPAIPFKSSFSQTTNSDEPHTGTTDHKPWADRYGPESLDELAVHKKKITDVQRWLDNALTGREKQVGSFNPDIPLTVAYNAQRLIVLKGPAGSGKTSTILLLAQTRGIQLVPWHNPTVSESGLASTVQQFGEFLRRGGEYESLELQPDGGRNPTPSHSQPRLMLVEEYPATMTRSSNILDTFRSILLQYLATTAQNAAFGGRSSSIYSHPPIVMIISETLISSSTALTDSFTAHRLLGPELMNHPLVTVIEFNPVAATFVQKALDLVVKKEARDSKRRRIPGPAVMSKIAEIGDVRSAVNSLQFFCTRGEDSTKWSGTVAGRSKRKDVATLTDMEKNTLQLVSQRESTLDMFHAAGKIVYNKREDTRVSETFQKPPPKPPDHIMHVHRPKPSQVNVDALLSETGTDIQTFVSTLHENYVLSCNGDDFVDYFEECSYFLSVSDVLNPDSRSLLRPKGNSQFSVGNMQTGNSDMLRQDEISFQVASRGLLFSLPSPVHRAVPPGARKQDAFKMFYPASLRIWKPMEEIHDLLSFYAHHGFEDASLLGNKTSHEGVATWRSRDLVLPAGANEDTPLVTGHSRSLSTYSSEDNQVLEILPFLTKIRAGRKEDVSTLRKITQFDGVHLSGEDSFDEDDEVQPLSSKISRTNNSTLSQKVTAAHNSIKLQQIASLRGAIPAKQEYSTTTSFSSESGIQAGSMEKLYISDDDIQDD